MIRFAGVSFSYADAIAPTLAGVDLRVDEGEFCLVVGATGAGKSTLLQAVNGLVPHFSGGTLAGTVTVDGRDTRTSAPRDLADTVGYVGQNPGSTFVTTAVADELAYTMESLGLSRQAMRRRVEDVLDLLGLVDLRDRDPSELSGGQQQRVAIGAVLAANPAALVLDEPTSALDPLSAEDVLAALNRLVDDLGITVLVAEHRLERVLGHADTMIWLPGVAVPPVTGTVAEVAASCPLMPPVVDLGRRFDWVPPPLTVRAARTRAVSLRADLAGATTGRVARAPGPTVARTRELTVVRGDRRSPVVALYGVDLDLAAGTVTAVMGRNGSGKSTLLSTLAGLHVPASGHVEHTSAAAVDVARGLSRSRVGVGSNRPGTTPLVRRRSW